MLKEGKSLLLLNDYIYMKYVNVGRLTEYNNINRLGSNIANDVLAKTCVISSIGSRCILQYDSTAMR